MYILPEAPVAASFDNGALLGTVVHYGGVPAQEGGQQNFLAPMFWAHQIDPTE